MTPIRLEPNISKKLKILFSNNIANYYIVCCEAIRSALSDSLVSCFVFRASIYRPPFLSVTLCYCVEKAKLIYILLSLSRWDLNILFFYRIN